MWRTQGALWLEARYSECIMTTLSRGRLRPRIAVYCGSSAGNDPAFLAEARALGEGLAAAGFGVVFGGSNAGLMGAMADAALDAGAEVIGVFPDMQLGDEIAHRRLTVLERVSTMHQRKARIAALADAFIALPGGYGTLDEMFEVVTWAQLRIHAKPCVLINTAGYWDGLIAFLDTAVGAGFVKPANRGLLRAVSCAGDAVGFVSERLQMAMSD
jgi:uncharacterized protein (TIGR00730 family)